MQKTSIFLSVFLASSLTLSYAALPDLKKGEEIYANHCAVCHENGVAGAPKINEKKEWQPRLDEAKKSCKDSKQSEMEYLVTQVKNGKGVMPPGGTCSECSDSDYTAAIQYMCPVCSDEEK